MLKVLEKILYSSERGSFEGRLTATLSRVSASIICGIYLLIIVAFILNYGFVFDPEIINHHIAKFPDLFNSLSFIIIVTLVSITSMIPGLAAFFFGILEMRTKHGKKTAVWGLFGFLVGAINFYIIFAIITPS